MDLEKQNIVILCDFDGTITKQDVSDTAFTKWLGKKWDEIDQQWHAGKISMVELYEQCWSLVQANEWQLREFVDSIEIDPHVPEFIELSKTAGISVYLVSDGFDFYIEQILQKHGLPHLEYFANKLWFEGDTIKLSFDNQCPGCIQCGNCKRAVIDEMREHSDYVIYIGNGLSDRCAAEHADLVFAKDSLLKHCKEISLACVEYATFKDIIEHLQHAALFANTMSGNINE